MDRIVHMVDAKAAAGTIMTMAAASTSWIEMAEPIVTMVTTVLVGGATLWYTVERATKLRKERKDGENSKRDDGSVQGGREDDIRDNPGDRRGGSTGGELDSYERK